MEDKYIKLRELKLLQGLVLALKNQMEDTCKEIKEVVIKEYKYDEATDKEREVMDDIDNIVNEIDRMWMEMQI